MKPIRILVHSNSNFSQSGYGNQTDIFTRIMKADGHDPIVSAFYGSRGITLHSPEGIPILPGSLHPYGDDIIQSHRRSYKPDVSVILADLWVFDPDHLEGYTIWCPIDHDPAPPAVVERFPAVKAIWAMSRHGEKMIRNAGFTPHYVPHGVETEVFKPLPENQRTRARERMKVKPDTFFAVMVAANKGYPDRKSFRQTFAAWAEFVRQHPDSLLYVHTLFGNEWGGVNLDHLGNAYGIPPANLRFVPTYPFLRGDYNNEWLNDLYNAADVLLAPSAGEGFGIPVIEAQAAGCPVIVSDFTAQTELCGAGWLIPIDPLDDREFTAQASFQARPKPSEILNALELAYDNRGNVHLRELAREFAMEYDARKVWTDYMFPAIREQVDENREQVNRTRAREDLRLAQSVRTRHNPAKGKPDGFKVPVSLTVYNRPDLTRNIMTVLQQIKPQQLFIIADSAQPHINMSDEAQVENAKKVSEVFHTIEDGITWDCDVHWNQATRNLGAGDRGRTGYDWLFSCVDRAVVLEDDTLPHPDFFRFCEEMLTRYEDNKRITMISGYNYLNVLKGVKSSYVMTRYAASWGWATWRDRWQHYDHWMTSWGTPEMEDRHKKAFKGLPEHESFFRNQWNTAIEQGAQTWDLRWAYARMIAAHEHGGLGIVPTRSLITNVGVSGTHRPFSARHLSTPVHSLPENLVHPEYEKAVDAFDKPMFEAMLDGWVR